MFVYSKKIVQFMDEIKSIVKVVLSKEIGLKIIGDRFYNRRQTASYPIRIVIFNNKSMLGYFEPTFLELGFHECLMHARKEQLHNVIRHELAHYMTFIDYPEADLPHGNEFKTFCQLMRWGEEVSKATICLESEQAFVNQEENIILRRVQKLMALSTSSNTNEAEQAMIKAQQLLLKHNIETKYIDDKNEEKVFLKRILKQKKENAKMRAIAIILGTFFVNTVYSRAGDFIYLEIMGNAVNVEIAEYVADVLQNELEILWNQAQLSANLKGMVAKNSFFLGLAKGYCDKIQALKREYKSDITNALIVIEKQLAEAKKLVYPSLTNAKRGGNFCKDSASLGEQMGRQLNINPALNKSGKDTISALLN